jgi:hypothetical protein
MMKKFACAAAVAAAAMVGGQASAEELWTPHLPGVDGNSATGALPPPGFYFVNNQVIAGADHYNNSGNADGNKATALIEVPVLLWSAPFQVLGAQYAAAIAQPWDLVNFHAQLAAGATEAFSQSNAFATVVIPGILSWSLPNDLHVAASLAIYVPDGGWQNPNFHTVGNLNSLDFYSFEPAVAVSWLHDGWNVSVKGYYNANMKDEGMNYTSGDIFGTEETITKTFGKWTVGVTGYTETQVTNDTGNALGVITQGNKTDAYAAGPAVGYNFGPVILDAYYTHDFAAQNGLGGDKLFTRFVVPLGNL